MIAFCGRYRRQASSIGLRRQTAPRGTIGRIGLLTRLSNTQGRQAGPAQIAAGVVNEFGKPKYTGLHSLRHFFALWCINRRIDGGLELPLKLQSRLGHSTC